MDQKVLRYNVFENVRGKSFEELIEEEKLSGWFVHCLGGYDPVNGDMIVVYRKTG